MCSDGHVSFHLARGPFVGCEAECCSTFNFLEDKLFRCVELACYGVHDCFTFGNTVARLKKLNHLFETLIADDVDWSHVKCNEVSYFVRNVSFSFLGKTGFHVKNLLSQGRLRS